MENTLNQKISFRLTNRQIQMFDLLQKKVLPNYSKSEIIRILLETIYTKAVNSGY